MKYKDRFKGKAVKVEKFRWEDEMVDFINKNIDSIEIVQIYTVPKNESHMVYFPDIYFHLMYKIKEKKTI